jgi:serine/threonine protein kinase
VGHRWWAGSQWAALSQRNEYRWRDWSFVGQRNKKISIFSENISLRDIERLTVNTGRVIQRRYLLEHVIERGAVCAIYQGFDHVLQRNVAVRVVPAEHIPAYRAAIRATSQFAHPNITVLFDVIAEPEALYIVEEYVQGDDFGAILRSNPTPYEVCDLGIQICQALIYAGTSSRKICHGDLTPTSIIRDHGGHIHINNFALPSDTQYFAAWSVVGSGGLVLSDPELPYGQISEGRRGDDTRAVGLLLYQLLSGRPADATQVEPPPDGRLRFQRNVPPELCELIARTIVRIHPQRILTPDILCAELKQISEALEAVETSEPPAFPTEDIARLPQFAPAASSSSQLRSARQTGNLVSTLPARDLGFDARPKRTDDLSRTIADVPFATAAPSAVGDMSMKFMAARQAAYSNLPHTEAAPVRKINVPAIIMIGLVLFAIFFGIGFLIARAIFP